MAGVTVRMNTETRKQQIVGATLEIIGRYGIQGATISRIAKRAGITPAALYAHFENRRAILVSALDEVYAQILDSFQAPSCDDPIQRFREILERHAQKVLSQDKTSHAHLFLEFVASAPEEGLREVLREKEQETTAYLISIVRGYQDQGRLPPEVDAEMVALLVASWAWTGDVANLMDASAIWHAKVSNHLMESILAVLGRDGGVDSGSRDSSDCLPESVEHPTDASGREDASPAPGADEHDGLPEGAVFTVDEVAAILKITPHIVRQMVSQGRLATLELANETRIPRRALAALLHGMSDREVGSP